MVSCSIIALNALASNIVLTASSEYEYRQAPKSDSPKYHKCAFERLFPDQQTS
jgi:hypothetical protein